MKRKPFFTGAELMQEAPIPRLPQCGQCGLYKTCESPKMEPSGKGKRGILVLAEAPGAEEDDKGLQLVGESGRLFQDVLKEHGLRMRRDCRLHSALACRPPNNEISAKKENKWLSYCRPNLVRAVDGFNPTMIILMGAKAVKSALGGYLYHGDVGKFGRWIGQQIPHQKLNAWICPTWHPAFLLRNRKDEVLHKLFSQHIKEAIKLSEARPWTEVPDYRSQVELIYKPQQAAKIIRGFIKKGGDCAFDYESNMLKPDSDQAEVLCASICWRGKRTIAFPWMGEAIDAFREFVLSPLPKIGWNIKHETRWTRRILKCGVKNWKYDGMLGAHTIDNTPGITGLKFQAFATLGFDTWDNVEEYKKSEGGNSLNRLKEVDLKSLLLYNGVDSLLTYLIGEIQQRWFTKERHSSRKGIT